MKISSKSWKSYIDRLSRIDQKAAKSFADWFRDHPDAETDDLLNYAYYTSDYYGNAASELACEMYDEVAVASGKIIPPAEPARTATFGEVAKAIQGKLLTTQDPDAVGAVVGTKVKTVGLDTLLNNSLRDGAEWAWVPSGDTCAFCIMLASNGWQRASKKALKNGHAEHVHNNCNCTYAIRFDKDTEVEGYDPEYYKDLYDNAEGDNWEDKVNSMRRGYYARNKDAINIQKRNAYEERNRRLELGEPSTFSQNMKTISARPVKRFENNHLYVSDDVKLSKSETRWINNRITKAKSIMGIEGECDIPIVVVNDSDRLASYNPRSNILFISSQMTNEKNVRQLQKTFTAPQNINSTTVHELLHWQDAELYRKTIGEIGDASINSKYSVYQRDLAIRALEKAGIDLSDPNTIKNEISEYARKKLLANDFEEVYTEYRTKLLLEG